MSHRPAPTTPTRPRQRGAALLTAMVIVTLVATLAASMIWQQWRAVQIEAAERSRAQSAWILQGALDWSRLTFLAIDRDRTDDAPEAFLSGRIEDAQSRFNLRNLVNGPEVSEPDVQALARLCETAEVPSALAQTLAEALRSATLAKAETAPLPPQSIDQVTWLGIDADSLRRLRRYVVLLPSRTPVNLNTAQREVIAAAVAGLDLATAERLVQERQRSPFKSLAAAQALLPTGIRLDPQRVSVASRYFVVTGRLRLDERVLDERSLVERRGVEVIALSRERVAGIEETQ
jgi:general secretion pathway protein K